MEPLTPEQRRARIEELERELALLRAQENEALGFDHAGLLEECRTLKNNRRPMEATQLYRSKCGCGLREAYDAVMAL